MAATLTPPPVSSPELSALPPRIVFFDGLCAFCDGLVPWLIARDPDVRLRFAPLQGPTAEVVRRAFPGRFPEEVDTMVYLHPGDGADGRQISLRSAAALAVCEELQGGWKRLRLLRWLPRFLTDLGYRLFGACRYRIFGKLDACRIPTPGERARLLP